MLAEGNAEAYDTSNVSLKWQQALSILKNFDPQFDNYVNTFPKANGGEMFIFFTEKPEEHQNLTTDTYQWKSYGAFKKCIQDNKVVLLKSYYKGN